MRFVVATHGRCLDGLASAVLMTRLGRATESRTARFDYRTCGYGAAERRASVELFDGDRNALLDYRYCPAERLDWYFDHHRTALEGDAARAGFAEREPLGRHHLDPRAPSCTGLIARIGRARFSLDTTGLEELERWAEIVDSAAFERPEDALDLSRPALRLAAVLEQHGDDALVSELVPLLDERPLVEVATLPLIAERALPIAAAHHAFVERVRGASVRVGRVVLVDLGDEPVAAIGKFVAYALHPDAVFSVVVGRLQTGMKISLGHNPWSGAPCDRDLSALAAAHGGGGHRVVSAISLPAREGAEARALGAALARELAS